MDSTIERAPRLAFTMGDPAGIGPEVAVKTAFAMRGLASVALYGAPDILSEAARRFAPGLVLEIRPADGATFAGLVVGKASAASGLAALRSLDAALDAALAGEVDAIVTAPMSKLAVNLAGVPFTGHTERLAERCGVRSFAMRQSSGKLRVAFATTHIPLREVASALTRERIVETALLLAESIRAEGVADPLLGVAGLNPHAGESGHMGTEELEVVQPAMEALRGLGVRVEGPFPPDTLFLPANLSRFDGFLCMYHDQGHIPFKMLAFHTGVNMTLGLPVIRTSPDHGTAFDIAWKGVADPSSMTEAARLAAAMAAGKRRL